MPDPTKEVSAPEAPYSDAFTAMASPLLNGNSVIPWIGYRMYCAAFQAGLEILFAPYRPFIGGSKK